MKRLPTSLRLLFPLMAVAIQLQGQNLLLDGFNYLFPGTAPDATQGFYGWSYPWEYVAGGVAETNDTEFMIVSAPNGGDQSLCLQLLADPNLPGNQHLPIEFEPLLSKTNTRIVLDFDIFVYPGHGGGAVYLSDGTYGVARRGPQILWQADGEWVVLDSSANRVSLNYRPEPGNWYSVRLLVNLAQSRFDFYACLLGETLSLISTDLPFRGGPLTQVDRIGVARFLIEPDAWSCFDNFSLMEATVGAPQFLRRPSQALRDWGYDALLTVVVEGAEPMAYQWFRVTPDGSTNAIPDATNSQCEIPWDYEDLFYVVASNPVGAIQSNPAFLSHGFPASVSMPDRHLFSPGETVLLFSGAWGEPAPEIQWFKDDVQLIHQTSAILMIPHAKESDSGMYRVLLTQAGDYEPWIISAETRLVVHPSFQFNVTQLNSTNLLFSFPTLLGAHYVLQSQTQLDWWGPRTKLSTNSGTGATITLTNTIDNSRQFYRIQVQ